MLRIGGTQLFLFIFLLYLVACRISPFGGKISTLPFALTLLVALTARKKMIKLKEFKSVGITGYGAYLPYWRIKTSEIAENQGVEEKRIKNLGVNQKAVANYDEDCLTMAVEASLIAIKRAGISPKKIGAVFVGSESHPYAVKPTGTILGDILGLSRGYFCADLQFACKAGTAGLQIAGAMIEAGMIDYGLVVGADKAQAEPGDALEYTTAAGAAAFVLGGKKGEFIARLISTYSFSSDTPDFWRRPGCKFPSHTGRLTGEPGYFYHLQTCLEDFLKKINKTPKDFDYAVFHMPNSKFPLKVAKNFGFTPSQMDPGLLVSEIGNPYAASSPLGLVAVLDQARSGKNILLVSYGSGAGSDAFWWQTKPGLRKKQKKGKNIKEYLSQYQQINYLSYLRNYGILL